MEIGVGAVDGGGASDLWALSSVVSSEAAVTKTTHLF